MPKAESQARLRSPNGAADAQGQSPWLRVWKELNSWGMRLSWCLLKSRARNFQQSLTIILSFSALQNSFSAFQNSFSAFQNSFSAFPYPTPLIDRCSFSALHNSFSACEGYFADGMPSEPEWAGCWFSTICAE